MNLTLDNPVAQNIMLEWDQPNITDFDHFNIYWSSDGGTTYPKLDSTIGVQYFLTVPANGLYKFYVTTVDRAGHESVPSNIVQTNVVIGLPDQYGGGISMIKLGPNPFSGMLAMAFNLREEARVTIRVFDVNGILVKEVSDASHSAGLHQVMFDGTGLPAGVYVVRFGTAGGMQAAFKVIRSR
jgi:hypothetical protein